MRHGMAANFKPETAQFLQLLRREIARSAKQPAGDIKRRFKPELLQQGRYSDEVGFTAIIKGDCNSRLSREIQGCTHAEASPAGIFQPCQLSSKIACLQDVARITWSGLAKCPPGQFQLVIHQENYAIHNYGGAGCNRSFNNVISGCRNLGPHAMSPERSGSLLLQRSSVFSRVWTHPSALTTRAAPPATSHSCFGINVNVMSAKPAATLASL